MGDAEGSDLYGTAAGVVYLGDAAEAGYVDGVCVEGEDFEAVEGCLAGVEYGYGCSGIDYKGGGFSVESRFDNGDAADGAEGYAANRMDG